MKTSSEYMHSDFTLEAHREYMEFLDYQRGQRSKSGKLSNKSRERLRELFDTAEGTIVIPSRYTGRYERLLGG